MEAARAEAPQTRATEAFLWGLRGSARIPAPPLHTRFPDLKPMPRNADTKAGLARKLGCQRSTRVIYLNTFGGMCFRARWVSLWTTHSEYHRMRAKPEITRKTGLGGPDERVARTHNGQANVGAGGTAPLQSSIQTSPGILHSKGGEPPEISWLLRRGGNFWRHPLRTERAT